MQEFKDSRLKYLEMGKEFRNRTNDISLTTKQHQRICEQLAGRLAKERPTNANEFEKNEYLKNFVIKTSELNDHVLGILDYTRDLLNAIAGDSEAIATAKQKDTLRLQAEQIETLTQQREDLVKELYEQRRKNTATS